MNASWANFFPYFAGAFKLIVLAIGGYLAIKWHFDEDKRLREQEGEVFNTLSLKKKLVTALVITIVVTCLITLVVYATDWLLY
ncbi:hypothetical protein JC606_09425 [Vibrio sp. IB15]|uniref:Uncharacterized protein n=2 Tax=Vibrio TaxID=662 RepID=A0A2S7VFK1_9VIBR|nr:hypothetical protein [Vibrio splendidus]KAB0479672.1 hypothetical protein F7Q91_11755 [Vibrio chagasii]KZX64828.1 hypothetical protein A3712_19985 [Vibrio sp. HI00D65]MBJ2146589.1 hypothetical protein [Vibrio sp. IB15]NOI38286.1 hypothetical protein [Vibrio sp. 070316B]NOI85954.1 hypothetical protein [Vibrio sp. 99K-1]NOI94827.1 hypothetical protein [Vibrio sp. T3Y01]